MYSEMLRMLKTQQLKIRITSLDFRKLDILVYSKVFILLVLFCFIGLWLIDKVFSIYNWDLTFLEMLWVTIKSCAVVAIIFVPVDIIVHYRKRNQS